MDVSSPNADRRTFLAAAPAVALAGAIPATAAPRSADRAAWNAAMTSHLDAQAEAAAFQPIFDRTLKAWEAARPSMDTIHWREFPFANRHHVANLMNIDKAWRDFCAAEGKTWAGGSPESTRRMKDRYRAALDSVQAYRDANARHDAESGMDEADAKCEQLAEQVLETNLALMNMPAPDLAALRWKLDEIFARNSDGSTTSWAYHFVGQTVADYRRLLAEG